MTGDGLSESRDDDDHELDTVHALATDLVGQVSEEELS